MTPSGEPVVSLTPRGTETCRGCGHGWLDSVLDLGSQPLANALLESPDDPDLRFPLHLRICASCGLGQVGEYVLPDRIFSDYPYLSSMSASWVMHAKNFAQRQTEVLDLDRDHWVLEIASNDGYLLSEFAALGVRVLGVEPAENVASIARESGVPTISEFFGVSAAESIRSARGYPRLIVANNVMAHVPDLDDFVAGIADLCDGHTLVSIENPSFLGLLTLGQFDTIYHEHFSYLSAHSVARLAERHGLALINVEMLPTHGGSYRYWLGREGAWSVETAVDAAITGELDGGLLSREAHHSFATQCRSTVSGLQVWLANQGQAGRTLVAYGAAAKGNTLLNAAGVTVAAIGSVVDASPEKQGKFLPGSRIPILAPQELATLDPDDVLLLPWNLREEIAEYIGKVTPRARLWVAVPDMEQVPT